MRIRLHLRVSIGPWFIGTVGLGACLIGSLLVWQLLQWRWHPVPTWSTVVATPYPTWTRVPVSPTPTSTAVPHDDGNFDEGGMRWLRPREEPA